MGCRQGKQKSKANGPDTFDAIPEPGTPPPVDPRLPINARQVFKLKKSWKGIKRNMEATGVEMFIRLFRTNSELISLFKDFKDITATDDVLRENEALEHHALLVMSVIDEAICHIDEVDRIIELCTRVGATHSRFTGFTSDLFWNIEEPYLHAVRAELGDRHNDSMEEVYMQIFKFILSHLESGISQAREKKSIDDSVVLAKYSKAKVTKAELKRQISLSKQEEFFGKDYDRNKIAEILRQESLEREYSRGEPRQSTSGLQVSGQNSKRALDAISDKSPVSEVGVAVDESQSNVKENAPLLQAQSPDPSPTKDVKDAEVSKKEEKTGGGDKQPLLQDTEDNVCADIVNHNEPKIPGAAVSTTNQILRSNSGDRVIETCQSQANTGADSSGGANMTEDS